MRIGKELFFLLFEFLLFEKYKLNFNQISNALLLMLDPNR